VPTRNDAFLVVLIRAFSESTQTYYLPRKSPFYGNVFKSKLLVLSILKTDEISKILEAFDIGFASFVADFAVMIT
jgi:hypothetical protein